MGCCQSRPSGESDNDSASSPEFVSAREEMMSAREATSVRDLPRGSKHVVSSDDGSAKKSNDADAKASKKDKRMTVRLYQDSLAEREGFSCVLSAV